MRAYSSLCLCLMLSACAGDDGRAGADASAGAAACPDGVSCLSGVRITRKLVLTFEEVKRASFLVCLNDTCFEGRLADDAQKPANAAGAGIGFSVPEQDKVLREMSDFAGVVFVSDGLGGLRVKMDWNASSDSHLHDGDHYRLIVIHPDGRKETLIDSTVDAYQDNSLPPPCTQKCRIAYDDRV